MDRPPTQTRLRKLQANFNVALRRARRVEAPPAAAQHTRSLLLFHGGARRNWEQAVADSQYCAFTNSAFQRFDHGIFSGRQQREEQRGKQASLIFS